MITPSKSSLFASSLLSWRYAASVFWFSLFYAILTFISRFLITFTVSWPTLFIVSLFFHVLLILSFFRIVVFRPSFFNRVSLIQSLRTPHLIYLLAHFLFFLSFFLLIPVSRSLVLNSVFSSLTLTSFCLIKSSCFVQFPLVSLPVIVRLRLVLLESLKNAGICSFISIILTLATSPLFKISGEFFNQFFNLITFTMFLSYTIILFQNVCIVFLTQFTNWKVLNDDPLSVAIEVLNQNQSKIELTLPLFLTSKITNDWLSIHALDWIYRQVYDIEQSKMIENVDDWSIITAFLRSQVGSVMQKTSEVSNFEKFRSIFESPNHFIKCLKIIGCIARNNSHFGPKISHDIVKISAGLFEFISDFNDLLLVYSKVPSFYRILIDEVNSTLIGVIFNLNDVVAQYPFSLKQRKIYEKLKNCS
ncbi:hypothetical protein RCL1_007450 [Eukaryota sp. TZLM3-RCL]